MSGKAGRLVSGVVDVLTLGAVGTISASVGAIVLFNIVSTAPAHPMWQEIRCWTGLSFQGDELCFNKRLHQGLSEIEGQFEEKKRIREQEFQEKERALDGIIKKRTQEIAALEQRRQTLEGEKAQITQARAELEGKLKKLAEIEQSSTSFNLFTQKPWKRGLNVTTGIEYKSFVQSQEWNKAWCYVQFEMENGVRAELDLGKRFSSGVSSVGEVLPSVLDAGKFTTSDVLEARSLCNFPGAAS